MVWLEKTHSRCLWVLLAPAEQRDGPSLVTLLAAEHLEQDFKQVEITWHGDFMANPSLGREVCCVG